MAKIAGLIDQLLTKTEYFSKNPSGDAIEEHRQIDALLCELIEAEKVSTSPAVDLPNRQDKWPQFMRWCKEVHDIRSKNIEVKQVSADGEYGLFATRPFDDGEMVLLLPTKMFLSQETALADQNLSPIINDPIIKRMPNLVLSIHLLSEYLKGESSSWAPYLATLPRSYSTVLYLSHDELLQLSGSPLLEEVVKIKRNVARQYAYLTMKLAEIKTKESGNNNKKKSNSSSSSSSRSSPLSPLSYELFRWAVSTVMTRQNSVPSMANITKMTLALIPLWDMCNHQQASGFSTDYEVSAAAVVFYAMSNLQAGDEIFNYYGHRTNGDFFLNNGFVYTEHEKDAMRIKLGFSSGDPLYALKDALAKKINLLNTANSGQFELSHQSLPLNRQLLAFVRIFLLDKEQLAEWMKKSQEEADGLYDAQCEQLQFLNDKVANFLKMRCTLLLRKYPQVPAGGFLNQNVEKMIACEKAILSSHLLPRAQDSLFM